MKKSSAGSSTGHVSGRLGCRRALRIAVCLLVTATAASTLAIPQASQGQRDERPRFTATSTWRLTELPVAGLAPGEAADSGTSRATSGAPVPPPGGDLTADPEPHRAVATERAPDTPLTVVSLDRATGQETVSGLPGGLDALLPPAFETLPGPAPPGESTSGLRNFSDLTHIADPSVFPWSANVKIVSTLGGSTKVCSGVLVDPLHVLTAAQCIHEGPSGTWATAIEVTAGYHGGATPHGSASWSSLHAFSGWTGSGNFDYDIGMIDLSRHMGALSGWFGFGTVANCSGFTDFTHNSGSYPNSSSFGSGEELYFWNGTFDSCEHDGSGWTGNEVRIDRRGYAGQEGAGAYYVNSSDNTRKVYSVMSNGTDTYSDFVRVTSSIRPAVEGWITDDTPTTPDLVPLKVRASAAVAPGSQLGSFEYELHNYSTATWSGTLDVSVYLSTNDNISTSDTLIETHQVTATIGPMVTGTVTLATPPTIPAGVADGNYWIGVNMATADANSWNDDTDGWDASPLTVSVGAGGDPPTADAGGPYTVNEGSTVALDGNGSSDDGGIVSWEWDLDNDGAYDDATGATPTFPAQPDDATLTIGLRVADDVGQTDTDTATVTVMNVSPSVDAGADETTYRGSTLTIQATFSDDGSADTHTATFDWGDGSSTSAGTVDQAAGTVDGSHGYTANGTFTVTLTVTDDDGGSASDTATVTVTQPPGILEARKIYATSADPTGQAGADDRFGNDVAIDGDTIIVGAPHVDIPESNGGWTYLHERDAGGAGNWGRVRDGSQGPEWDPSGSVPGGLWGYRNAIEGDVAVSTARADGSGAAIVMYRNGGSWDFQKKLTPSDSPSGAKFGSDVATQGDWIVVGADGVGGNVGRIYLFEKDRGGADNWGEHSFQARPGVGANDRLGTAVDIDGDIIVAGSPGDDDNRGSAHIYYRNEGGTNNWGHVARICATDACDLAGDRNGGDQFGNSIAIQGDTIAVGALNDDDPATDVNENRGAVYIFERNHGGPDNWGLEQKLQPATPASNARFGRSLDMEGDRLIIGALNYGGPGRVFVFEKTGDSWVETASFTSSDGVAGDEFGDKVGISGSTVVVSATKDHGCCADSGSVYVFELGNAPVANDDSYVGIVVDTPHTVAADNGVLANDTDPDFDTLTAVKLTDPSHGTLDAFGTDGSFTYTPDKGFIGVDSFTYRARDGAFDSGPAPVSLNVRAAVDAPPVADIGGPYSVAEGMALDLDGSGSTDDFGITNWDWDFDNDGAFDDATGAAPTLPAASDNGSLALGLRVTDSAGQTDTTTTTVTVSNADPTLDAGPELVRLRGSPVDLLVGFTDPGSADTHTATIDWGDGSGAQVGVVDAAAGTIAGSHTYTADGAYTVGVTVTDDDGGSTSDSLVVRVRSQFGQSRRLVESARSPGNRFGTDVATDGETVIVGAAHSGCPAGSDCGSIHVFNRDEGGLDNWGLVHEMDADFGAGFAAAGDHFGERVEVAGDLFAAASPFRDEGAANGGAVFLFGRNVGSGFGLIKKIVPSTIEAGSRFGHEIDLQDDLLVVGHSQLDVSGVGGDAGALRLFGRDQGGADNWGELPISPLATPGLAGGDKLGVAVRVDGDTLVGGAVGAANGGEVHVYQRDQGGAGNWGHVATVTGSDVVGGSNFGNFVVVAGDRIAVGAPWQDGKGAVYVFERHEGGDDAWGQTAKLVASDGVAGDQFGDRVELEGDTVIVGAPAAGGSGKAYVYRASGPAVPPASAPATWSETQILASNDLASGDQFGHRLAISDGTLLVTSSSDDDNRGAAYVFGPLIAAPTADAGGPYAGTEGAPLALDGSASSGEGITAYEWDLDADGAYDDATGATPTFPAQPDNGVFTIGLRVTNASGQADTDSATVTIGNLAPMLDTGPDRTVGVNSRVSVGATFGDAGSADTHTATIDWGDGVSESGTVDPVALTITGEHIYANAGSYTVTVTVTDDDGGAASDSFAVTVTAAPDVAETGILSPEDAGGRFGYAVARDGEFAVVAAPRNDTVANDMGAAYVFRLHDPDDDGPLPYGWHQAAQLFPHDGHAGQRFGELTVAIDGDTVVVGSRANDHSGFNDPGAAYVFQRNRGGADNWGLVTKLGSNDPASGDNFGASVSISGDTIATGAYLDDNAVSAAGAMYIFERHHGGTDIWGQFKKITVPNTIIFGYSVSLDGDRMLVGSRYDNNENGSRAGATYLFERDAGGANNWGQVKRLIAPASSALAEFGFAVSLDGDRAAIGAFPQTDQETESGAAYVFERDAGGAGNWGVVATLLPPSSVNGDDFARSIAIDGPRVIVGAEQEPGAPEHAGAAYLFERDAGGTWSLRETLAPTTPVAGSPDARATTLAAADDYGYSVTLQGNQALIGAPGTDSDVGAVYLLDFEAPTASFTATPNPAAVDADVAFDASSSSARNGRTIVEYEWDFDHDGTTFTRDASGVSATHAYGSAGTFTAALRVTDSQGSRAVNTVTVAVSAGTPPTADAGGPYSVAEGSSLVLDGSGSTDSDGTITGYEWDLDNDGAYDDATGANPTFPAQPDDTTLTIGLRITDDTGQTDTDSTTVTITNAAPLVDAGPDRTLADGATLSLTASFADAGSADTHTAVIDWGDGASESGTVDASAGTVTGAHVYAAPGSYTVTVSVTDDDGGIGTDTALAQVVVASTGRSFVRALPGFDLRVSFDMAVDSAGDFYITDKENHRILKLDGATGDPLLSWGSWGTANGQFQHPAGIVVDGNDRLFVAGQGNNRIQKFATDGSFVDAWGGVQGSGDGQFWTPNHLALDSGGNLLVADGANHRVQRFAPDGTFLSKWGSQGSADGEFETVLGLAVGPGGATFATDRDGNRVQQFDETDTFVRGWGDEGGATGLDTPFDVAVWLDGNIFVVEAQNRRVQKFDPAGTFLTKWQPGFANRLGQLSYPRGLAVLSWLADTELFVMDQSRIQIFDDQLDQVGALGDPLDGPASVAVDPAGRIVIGDRYNQQVKIYAPNSQRLVEFWGEPGGAEGQFGQVIGVATDAASNVYVVDNQLHRVQVFDATGTFLRMWGWGVQDGAPAFQVCTAGCQGGTPGSGVGQLAAPEAIAVDSTGNVYVVDSGNDRIVVFDAAGNPIGEWGTSGSAEGHFDFPNTLAIDGDGNVLVADATLHRIQKFDSAGTFLRMWGWGVDDGAAELQVCTSGCQGGQAGAGAGQLDRPRGVAVDQLGRVHVTEELGNRVTIFDGTGGFLDSWGSSGSAEGEFAAPHDIAIGPAGGGIRGQRIHVADFSNNRIQTFAPGTPPNADAGGPYGTTPGNGVLLDGGSSSDDSTTLTYAWDLDEDGVFESSGSTATFSSSELGVFAVHLRVDDPEGASDVDSTVVRVTASGPPTADAGGPYFVAEGSSLALDGSNSNDDGTITDYAWDLNGDGLYDDASGSNPTLPAQADDATLDIGLRVTDDGGNSDNERTTVTVQNVIPAVEVGGNRTATAGLAVEVSGTLSDPGTADTHTATIDWGDGSSVVAMPVDSGAGTLGPIQHTYAAGSYTVIVSVQDDDMAPQFSTDTFTIDVSPPPAPDIRIDPTLVEIHVSATTLPPDSAPAASSEGSVGVSGRVQTPAQLDALSATVATLGSVRVIAELAAPFAPAGQLAPGAEGLQQAAIATAQQQVIGALAATSSRVTARYRYIPFLALEVDAAGLQALAASADVLFLEPDVAEPPIMASSNALIGSPAAWSSGYDGSDQIVAVLDTGVDKTHPFFSTGPNKVVSEACYSSNTGSSLSVCPGGVEESIAVGSGANCSLSDCDHGTHVAGTAAGNDGAGPDFGVARGADVLAIQVFSDFDGNALSWVSDQIKGLERVYELRDTFDIAAVNLSLGGSRYFDAASCDAANASRKAAIDNLRSAGIATIAAAGNDGYTNSMGSPACISSAISVGATTDADEVAWFSNVVSFLDLHAPGASITSALPGGGTGTWNGTSMATPHVAGAFAVLRQADPSASVSDLLSALRDTGTPVDDMRTGGTITGIPRINLDQALDRLLAETFTIFNDGNATLTVTSLTPSESWTTLNPAGPFTVPAGEARVVEITLDEASVPLGTTDVDVSVVSDDPDENPSNVTVRVHKILRTLTVALAGDGSGSVSTSPAGIDCGADCSEGYDDGMSVTLTATPDAGSLFNGWSGHCTGTDPALTVIMDQDRSCTATFVVDPGTVPTEIGHLTDSAALFGWAVGVDGDTAVVGAVDAGEAFIFERNLSTGIWEQARHLDIGSGQYGCCVAISGDTVVVGARLNNWARVYERDAGGANNWGQVAQLTGSDAVFGSRFGYAVAISGDRIVVGAQIADSSPDDDAGGAYVFERDEGGAGAWGEVTRLVPDDPEAGDHFGASVAVEGSTIIVGAPDKLIDGERPGAAYVFELFETTTSLGASSWNQRTRLTAADGFDTGFFGRSVAVSGDYALIGAPTDDDAGADDATEGPGAAYLFARDQGGDDNWGQLRKLTAADGIAGDQFGSSVAIAGHRAIVGATLDDDSGSQSGSAYLFARDEGGVDNWGQTDKLVASDAAGGDEFGFSVDATDLRFMVGARFGNAAYIYELGASGTSGPTAAAGGPYTGSEGSPVALDGSGSADDVGIASYTWDLDNDGAFDDATGVTPSLPTPADQGTFPIALRVVDTDGNADTDATTVTLSNVAPSVDAGEDTGLAVGGTLNLSSSFSDPGTDDTHTAQVNWGDGTIEALTVDQGAGTAAGSHAYSASGTFTVTVTVTDDDGDSGSDSLLVTTGHELTVSKAGDGFGTVSSVPAGIDCGADCGQLYDHGTSVTLTATPATGSLFSGWSGACTGTDPNATVLMDQARACTATFVAEDYELTVDVTGLGSGTVSSSPAGIGCEGDCSERYAPGTSVTLTATADAGSVFAGWTGACAGTDPNATVVMDQDRFCSASFDATETPTFVHGGSILATLVDPDGNGGFGHAVAIDGDRMAIRDTDNANLGPGIAILERTARSVDEWAVVGRAIPVDVATLDEFGHSGPQRIALEGDVLVVGNSRHEHTSDLGYDDFYSANQFTNKCPDPVNGGPTCEFYEGDGDLLDSGTVFVFHRDAGGPNNWGQVAELRPSMVDFDDFDLVNARGSKPSYLFGSAVAISGNTIAVQQQGAELRRVRPPVSTIHCGSNDGQCNDYYSTNNFSTIVSFYGRNEGGPDNWGLVGTINYNTAPSENGFTIPDGQACGIRSLAADLSGDTFAAVCEHSPGDGHGVGVFERNEGGPDNWGFVTRITDFGIGDGRQLGASGQNGLTIQGDTLLVGAIEDAVGASAATGAAYVYGRDVGGADNWGLLQRLQATDPETNSHFGWAVDLDGDVAVVQDPTVTGPAGNEGALYVYGRNEGGADNWGPITKLENPSPEGNWDLQRGVRISDNRILAASRAPLVGPGNVASVELWEPTVLRTLDVTVDGLGSGTVTSAPAGIDCGADCTESYANGTSVTLTATPAAGSVFNGWSGDCAGTALDATVVMDQNRACTATFAVEIVDEPPVADAGGPYVGDEGSTVSLLGSGSTDDNGIVSYEWDLDNDGVFDDAAGVGVSLPAQADDAVLTIGLRVTDGSGQSDVDSATVTILNVVPVPEVGGDRATGVGASLEVSGSFQDPGSGDTHAATIDWGDGGSESMPHDSGARSLGPITHAYAAPGTYTVIVTIHDDDEPTVGTDTFAVEVTAGPTAPGDLRVERKTRDVVQLAWNDEATTETRYEVQRRLSSESAFGTVTVLPADATSWTDGEVVAGREYVYRVLACDESECTGSEELTVRVPALKFFIGDAVVPPALTVRSGLDRPASIRPVSLRGPAPGAPS